MYKRGQSKDPEKQERIEKTLKEAGGKSGVKK